MGKSNKKTPAAPASHESKPKVPGEPKPGDDASQPRLVMFEKGPRRTNIRSAFEAWAPHLVVVFGSPCDFLEDMEYKKRELPKQSTYVKLVAALPDSHFEDDDLSDTSSNGDASDNDSDSTSFATAAVTDPAVIARRRKALTRQLYKKAVDECGKMAGVEEANRPKAYAWMLGMSDDKVKEALMGASKWDSVNRSKDPLRLARLMMKVLSTEPTKITADSQDRAFEAYHSCKQGNRQLTAYYKDFKERVEHMTDVGLPAFDPQTIALAFIKRLNETYSPLLVDIMNKRLDPPETLKEAYESAVNFYVDPRVASEASVGRDATHAITLATSIRRAPPAETAGGRGSGRGGDRGSKPKAPKSGASPNDVKAPHDGVKEHKKLSCFGCGEKGHILKNCPKKKSTDEAPPAQGHVTLAVHTVALNVDYGISGEEDKVAGMKRYEVGLDNMSSVHIVREVELLTNRRKAPYSIELHGVSGSVVLDEVGDFGPFGMAWYHPNGVGSVISQGRAVNDGAAVEFDSYHDEYSLQMGDWKWFFGRRRGVLVYTTRMEDLAACNLREHYDYGTATGAEIAMPAVETEETARRLYTQRELRGIERAKRLISSLGFPSASSLVRMVRYGKIRRCTVTPTDILNCIELHGPELARERGHRTRVPRPIVDLSRQDAEGVLVESDVCLHVDLMFVERVTFLVSMASPMKYLMANFVSTKSTAKLKDALARQKAKYTRQGFNVTQLLCDGESGVSALAPALELDVVRVDQAGPETHVPVIEVAIQYLKRMARGIVAAMAFVKIILPRLLIVWLIYFCVSRINMLPTRTLDGITSGREYYSGRALDAETDLACTFMERVEVHQKTTNTMAPRTRPALALVSSGNVYGTWKCFYLDTLKVGSMDAWTSMPMDTRTIDAVNFLSSKDRAPLTGELEFKLGDRVVELDEESPEELADLYKAYGRREMLRTPSEAPDYDPTELPPEQAVEIDDGVPIRRGVPASIRTAASAAAEADDVVLNNPSAPSASETISPGDIVVSTPLQQQAAAAEQDQEDPANGDIDDADDDSVHVPVDDATLGDFTSPTVHDDVGDEDELATVDESTEGRVPPPRGFDEDCMSRHRGLDEKSHRTLRPRRSDWKAGPWQARVYETGLHITVKQALDRFPDAAREAMRREIGVILAKRVTTPVRWQSLSHQQRRGVIRSSMFLKEKYLSTGEFEKLKARFVAGGNLQDRSVYSEGETSSPTVSISSAYMLMAIAAHEGRKVMTMDVGGAYLNADMKREVLMRVDSKTASVFVELDPAYADYLDKDGSLIVKLDKALYGCIESSKLWFDNISTLLLGLGFKANEKDACVFNKMTDRGVQLTVALYVDDLFCSCVDQSELEWLAEVLTDKYKEQSVHRGDLHSYLGHTLDFGSSPGQVRLTMEGYITDLLRSYEVRGTVATPASPNLFDVSPTAEPLDAAAKEEFHSRVAKLLYLAKRVRPDLLTAVSFLTTRVSVATVEDQQKLERVFKYLNATPEMGLVLQASKDLCLLAYIDASFAVHEDFKSRTGGVLSLGKGAVWFTSAKQKLVSKSSTEAELIALSDVLSQVIWTRDFLVAQGYDLGPAKVFQDNMSTIVLAEKGSASSQRTRHIGIRFFFVKDRIDSGEVIVEHLSTTEMVADLMTKPLQGDLFRKLRRTLLNWE